MKKLKLSTTNDFTLLDDEDYVKLGKYKWRLHTNKYAVYGFWINGKTVSKYLHRVIMGEPKGKDVDHINHNKLDNRKVNLRICPKSYNSFHQRKRTTGSSSKYKGVHYDKSRNMWIADIALKPKRYRLGRFKTEKEAAIAYNNKAKELLKDFAVLNNID